MPGDGKGEQVSHSVLHGNGHPLGQRIQRAKSRLFLFPGVPVPHPRLRRTKEKEGIEGFHLTGLGELDFQSESLSRIQNVLDPAPGLQDILFQPLGNKGHGQEGEGEEEKGKPCGPGSQPPRSGRIGILRFWPSGPVVSNGGSG